MIDSRPGTTKKPTPTGEEYFPQSRPVPPTGRGGPSGKQPSQKPAPKAPFDD